MVILQFTLLVFLVEEINGFLIFFLNLFLGYEYRSCLGLRLELDALDRHHGHEIVGRVAQIRTLESDGPEVIYGKTGLIEVDNFTSSEKHQSIETFEDV